MAFITYAVVIFWFCHCRVNSLGTAKLGLISKTENDVRVVQSAIERARSIWSDATFELQVFDSSKGLQSYLQLSYNVSKVRPHVLIEAPSEDVTLRCLIRGFGIPVIASQINTKCQFNNLVASISEDQNFTASVVRQLLLKNNWKEAVVLFDEAHQEELQEFLWQLSLKFRLHRVFVSFDVNGKMTNSSRMALTNIVGQTAAVEISILLMTQKNLKLFFKLLENELAEIKGFLSNYLLYKPTTMKSFDVSGDYTVSGLHIPIADNNIKTTSDAMLYDASLAACFVGHQLLSQCTNNLKSGNDSLNCVKEVAPSLFNSLISKADITGLTGKIQFDSSMIRKGINLDIVNLQKNQFKKIGDVDANGLVVVNNKPVRNIEQSLYTINLGRPLIISMIWSGPFIFDKWVNGSYTYYGLLIDIVDEVCKMLNIKYELHLVKDLEYGRLKNGKWTGMVGDVLYQRADIAVSALTITSLRETVVDFIPFMDLEIVYTKKRAEVIQRSLFEFLEPFTAVVWVIFLTVLCSVGILIYTFERRKKLEMEKEQKRLLGESEDLSLGECIWFVSACTLQQSSDEAPKSLPGRILVGFFWFMIMIFIATYTANLAAFFTSRRAQYDPTELEEFLKLNYTFSVAETSALHEIFASSENPIYKMIIEKMETGKTFVSNSIDGVLKTRANKNFIYIGEEPFVRKRTVPPCNTYIVKGIMPPKSFGFPVRKNSPLRQPIAIAISKLIESGFIERRSHYWFDVHNENNYCTNVYKKTLDDDLANGQVDIFHFWGTSFTIGTGAIVALLCLTFEHFWKKKAKEKLKTLQLTSLRRKQKPNEHFFGSSPEDKNALKISVKQREPSFSESGLEHVDTEIFKRYATNVYQFPPNDDADNTSVSNSNGSSDDIHYALVH